MLDRVIHSLLRDVVEVSGNVGVVNQQELIALQAAWHEEDVLNFQRQPVEGGNQAAGIAGIRKRPRESSRVLLTASLTASRLAVDETSSSKDGSNRKRQDAMRIS